MLSKGFSLTVLIEKCGMRNAKSGNNTAPDAILNFDLIGASFDKVDGALSDTGNGSQFSPGERLCFSDLLYSCHCEKDSKNIS